MKMNEIIKRRLLGKIDAEFIEENGETFVLFDAIRLMAGSASEIVGVTLMWKGQALTDIPINGAIGAGSSIQLTNAVGRIKVNFA